MNVHVYEELQLWIAKYHIFPLLFQHWRLFYNFSKKLINVDKRHFHEKARNRVVGRLWLIQVTDINEKQIEIPQSRIEKCENFNFIWNEQKE